MSEDSLKFDVEPEIYRKLQKRLDKFPIGYPETESGVEIRLLKLLFSPEEAQIAINLRLIPEPLKKIYRRVKKYGITKEQLKQTLDELYFKGSISRGTEEDDSGDSTIVYSIAFLAIGMFEYQVNRLTKEFYEDFELYMDEAFRDEVASTKINQIRTIPVEKSLTPEHIVATYDQLRKIIENDEITNGKIAVTNCVCRQGKDLLGEPCKRTNMRELCFTFDTAADHGVEKSYARYISKEEALKILDKAQEDGLIIQPGNAKTPAFICCCCGCCCDMITNIKKLERPWDLYHTNYFAEVDEELCVGCGTCVDRCQLDAITLEDLAKIDQNLCIGCGNCVVSCSEEAISLKKKHVEEKPPKTMTNLYLNIMNKKAELRRAEKGTN